MSDVIAIILLVLLFSLLTKTYDTKSDQFCVRVTANGAATVYCVGRVK